MTNTAITMNSKMKKNTVVIPFPTSKVTTSVNGSDNIIRFDVFVESMVSGRADWKGRALVILGHIRSCLYWEQMLIGRRLYDRGEMSDFALSQGLLMAEYNEDQCMAKFQYHLMKAVRSACAFNSELSNNMGKRFITRKIKRSDEVGPYNFSLADSIKMVHDFAESFDDKWGGGGSIVSIRWDLKLKAHQAEQEQFAA